MQAWEAARKTPPSISAHIKPAGGRKGSWSTWTGKPSERCVTGFQPFAQEVLEYSGTVGISRVFQNNATAPSKAEFQNSEEDISEKV